MFSETGKTDTAFQSSFPINTKWKVRNMRKSRTFDLLRC